MIWGERNSMKIKTVRNMEPWKSFCYLRFFLHKYIQQRRGSEEHGSTTCYYEANNIDYLSHFFGDATSFEVLYVALKVFNHV